MHYKNIINWVVIKLKKIVFILIVVLMFSLVGCSNTISTNNTTKYTDEEITELAKLRYLDYIKSYREEASIDDVLIYKNLGVYNNCFVGIFLDRENSIFIEDLIFNQTIDGLDFRYSYRYFIVVYHDDFFYYLKNAYYSGLLSRSDLETIHKIYYNIE